MARAATIFIDFPIMLPPSEKAQVSPATAIDIRATAKATGPFTDFWITLAGSSHTMSALVDAVHKTELKKYNIDPIITPLNLFILNLLEFFFKKKDREKENDTIIIILNSRTLGSPFGHKEIFFF
jgi:hypothetical protein